MFLTHSFCMTEATNLGIEKAIILYQFRLWLTKNKANEVHIYDGHVWLYNTAKAFEKLFPYMKARTIGRHLQELEELGIIKSGNYNHSTCDRTKWYTIIGEFEYTAVPIQPDKPRSNGFDTSTDFSLSPPPSPKKPTKSKKSSKSQQSYPSRQYPDKSEYHELPKDFMFTEELRQEALEKGWPDIDKEFELFKNHALQNKRKCVRWNFAFRTWLLKAHQWQTENLRSSQNGNEKPYVNPKLAGIHQLRDSLLRDELGDDMYDENGEVVSYDLFACLREPEPTIREIRE